MLTGLQDLSGQRRLEVIAEGIPQMGGRQMGPFLRAAARDVPPNTAIVELGCWLGAGTAQMMLGLRDRGPQDVSMHVFDNFHTSAASAQKAGRQGWSIREGDDVLELVRRTLEPFGIDAALNKGMLGADTKWNDGPISLYVDDATKYSQTFYHCLKVFGPHWIPGKTVVVLMDVNLFRYRTDLPETKLANMRAQYDFMDAHRDHFQQVPTESKYRMASAYRYIKPIDFAALVAPCLKRRRPEGAPPRKRKATT